MPAHEDRTGVTDDELDELLFQIAAYCGAPAGNARPSGRCQAVRAEEARRADGDGRLRRARQHGQRPGGEPGGVGSRRGHPRRWPAASAAPTVPRFASSLDDVGTARRGRRAQPSRRLGVGAGGARPRRGARSAHRTRRRHVDHRRGRRPGHRRAASRRPPSATSTPRCPAVSAGARARTLSVMYAGSDAACAAVEPVLAGLSDRRRRVGDQAGHGPGAQAGQQLPVRHRAGRHERGGGLRPVGRVSTWRR